MKVLQKLHEKHNIYPERKEFYLTYQYVRSKNTWEFVGYRCSRCSRTLKFATAVPRHVDNCKVPAPIDSNQI